ncbi:methyltransferase domain-containing protein [Rhodovulum sp. FJ3]|uniref:methyltransferase domain-containing protein n=1 Tax=Rhodovulum sp. FJ3 TaxID=3079053 RepID=UPI00293DDD88|nr:methyltransferase domain-containing protein [Rhodovulum sp. FJ3]MDV4169103.1 methyltransferase domain-containing protein [Rhodovulum sp. FJ3]
MSQTPPKITDVTALRRNRARALNGTSPAMFLQHEAAIEVQERLSEVNRTFTDVAVVSGFPEIWTEYFPEATHVPDDEVLNLPVEQFDLVIHGLCLHWANDPVGQVIQSRRALRPDGLFMGVMFGGQTLFELRATLAEAEIALTGGLSPRVLPMGEIRDLGALIGRAGLNLPVADLSPRNVSYRDAIHLMRDLRAMGEVNALTQRHRKTPPRQLFVETAERYAATYGDADGRIPATFELVFLTGWAPDESQPKPLRPGSAKTRLADALGAFEMPTGEKIPPKDV